MFAVALQIFTLPAITFLFLCFCLMVIQLFIIMNYEKTQKNTVFNKRGI